MEGYLTEIRLWAPLWAPRNWASCSGQLLPISNFNAVFSLIGTLYGGDGRTTFQLPDLRGRVAVGAGNGPVTTPRSNGQTGGAERVTLNDFEMPAHTHQITLLGDVSANLNVSNAPGISATPAPGNSIGAEAASSSFFYNNENPNTTLNASSIDVNNTLDPVMGISGASSAHNNMEPYQVMLPIICLAGMYPSRN